jgi:hypothetical protein
MRRLGKHGKCLSACGYSRRTSQATGQGAESRPKFPFLLVEESLNVSFLDGLTGLVTYVRGTESLPYTQSGQYIGTFRTVSFGRLQLRRREVRPQFALSVSL